MIAVSCILLLPDGAYAHGSPDPRYRVEMVTYDAQEDPIRIHHLLDAVPRSTGTPLPIQGFSYGLCMGPGMVLHSVEPGLAVADLNGGYPPAAVFLDMAPVPGDGFTIGLVIDFTGTYQLPPGEDHEILVARYGNPGSVTNLDLWYCDHIGTPPVEVIIVENTGYAAHPVTDSTVAVLGPPPDTFERGDCNRSGSVSLPDVVALLIALFPPPGANITPPCLDACDANDDGNLTLGDAIGLLNALFAVPPIPLPGPGGCLEDPTDTDPLDCAHPTPCP